MLSCCIHQTPIMRAARPNAIKLRDYQLDVERDLALLHGDIRRAPCASGKTAAALNCIKKNALIVCPGAVALQWMRTMREMYAGRYPMVVWDDSAPPNFCIR